jgi:hypothetical protein
MLSIETRGVYRRLLVLGLLVTCLVVITSSPATRKVFAAACIQDCEAYEAQCRFDCADDCSTSDAACSSCHQICSDQFRRCMRMAVWCDDGPIVNERCSVNFGLHEDSIDGNHSGYSQLCPGLGGTMCWHCPPGEICHGTDSSGNPISGSDGYCSWY